jgi:hypothetical protein
VALDQQANKIKKAIETHFQCEVIKWSMSQDADQWGYGFYGNPMSSFKVMIEVRRSYSALIKSNSSAFDISDAIKSGVFDIVLGDVGRLIRIETNMNMVDGFNTTLEFLTSDIEAFANAFEDFGYKAYANQFDALMTKTLYED